MRQGRRWLRRTGWGVVVTAIGAMSIGVEPSLAASGWVAPLDIAPVGAASASRPQIVLDAKGNAISVWRRGGAVGTDMTVQSAVRPAGGPWQAPVDLSRPGPDEGPPALERPGPQLAIDSQGNAVAVWQRFNGTSLVVQAAERPAGGAWRAPVDISGISASGGDSRNPRVVVDPSGTALAVWVRRNPLTGGYQLQSAERPAGGTWQAPIGASSVDEASAVPLDVAIDARGTALAVWVRNAGGVPQPSVVSTAHPAGGAWLAPEVIPDPASIPYDVDVAVDPAGNAVASWSDFSAAAKAALRPVTGGWGAAIPLGSSGHDATVGMDSAGTATVVFAEGLDEIRAVSHPAGGGWLPEVRVNAGGRGASSPALVVDAHGDATAAWTDATGPRPSIMVGRRAGGSWQPPIRLTADERSPAEPDVAVDPAGNAVAAWSDTTAGIISAAGFDATPPELRAVGVPASGAAGRSVSFSATPFDTWSATLATTWTFGDGAAATGNLVAHTYKVVGTRTVGVSTKDLVGNSTATTRTILIRPSVLDLRVTPNAFRRKRPGAVGFRLAAAARVRFVLERVRVGRRVGSRCVAATPTNRRRAACTRYVRVGSFSRSRPSGRTRFRLPASVARRLAAGRYRLSATPRVAGLSGKPSRAGLRITG